MLANGASSASAAVSRVFTIKCQRKRICWIPSLFFHPKFVLCEFYSLESSGCSPSLF